jgi:hypothetical protein
MATNSVEKTLANKNTVLSVVIKSRKISAL